MESRFATRSSTLLSLFLFLFCVSFVSSARTSSIEDVCKVTLYKDLCRKTLDHRLKGTPNSKSLLEEALKAAEREAQRTHEDLRFLFRRSMPENRQRRAVEDCVQLMDLTVDQVRSSLAILGRDTYDRDNDLLKSLLSAAITNHDTCMDSLSETSKTITHFRRNMKRHCENGRQLCSNALAIYTHFCAPPQRNSGPPATLENGFPRWISRGDRRMLLASDESDADVVVATDGTGNFTTITSAIDAAPNKSEKRFIIFVKKGVYEEYVQVGKSKTNIFLIGESMDTTIITGNRNVVDNYTTFNSASFAVTGSGFMARDIAFLNTAGWAKHQAVALRVGSDQSVFYRCRMEAYQDTLYAHSLRQFYRACRILGTVDFIFGNAAAVFQSCTLVPRKPGSSQKNAVTAQGRTDPNQNTGTSIQDCVITGDPDLVAVATEYPTFLGRPWKEYSRTVVMQSYIGDVVDPAGWLPWSGDFALSTLYYAEYLNSGPRANTTDRVNWAGYHVLTSEAEALPFTVKEFIGGDTWLPATGVEFVSGLDV